MSNTFRHFNANLTCAFVVDPVDTVITHGSSSAGVPDHPVQTWIKNFAIIADPNAHAGTNRLRLHKRGFSSGVGEWDLYWWSDVVRFRRACATFRILTGLTFASSPLEVT